MRGTSKVYLLLYYIIQVLCLRVFFQLVIPFQAVLVTASRGGLHPRPLGRGISPHNHKKMNDREKACLELSVKTDKPPLAPVGKVPLMPTGTVKFPGWDALDEWDQ